jgi:glucose-6-phosphate 1-dehydrogenase
MPSGNVVKISPIDDKLTSDDTAWLTSSSLSIVVVGASGDLAKKKTYPSLLNLFDDNLLPKDTLIWGFARSSLTDDDLRDRLRPYLLSKKNHSPEVVEAFLQICRYEGGTGYGDEEAFGPTKRIIRTTSTLIGCFTLPFPPMSLPRRGLQSKRPACKMRRRDSVA